MKQTMNKGNFNYNPGKAGCFQDINSLMLYLNVQMRTDITQKWTNPLTRGNLYFLIGEDGMLQYYCNVQSVEQRQQLKGMVLSAIKGVSLDALREETINFHCNFPKDESLEGFFDHVEEILPKFWNMYFHKGESSTAEYLDSTVFMILHLDESFDGDVILHHIHRLSVNNPKLLKR